MDNSSFARVEEVKYLGRTLANQNSIQEEIKSRLVRECLLSFSAEFLSSSLLLSNLKNRYTEL